MAFNVTSWLRVQVDVTLPLQKNFNKLLPRPPPPAPTMIPRESVADGESAWPPCTPYKFT